MGLWVDMLFSFLSEPYVRCVGKHEIEAENNGFCEVWLNLQFHSAVFCERLFDEHDKLRPQHTSV